MKGTPKQVNWANTPPTGVMSIPLALAIPPSSGSVIKWNGRLLAVIVLPEPWLLQAKVAPAHPVKLRVTFPVVVVSKLPLPLRPVHETVFPSVRVRAPAPPVTVKFSVALMWAGLLRLPWAARTLPR